METDEDSIDTRLGNILTKQNTASTLRKYVLLPTESSYPAPIGEPSPRTLDNILSGDGSFSVELMIKKVTEFCTYGRRYCHETQCIIEDRSRWSFLLEVTKLGLGKISDIIAIGLSHETVVPFHVSAVIISDPKSRDVREIRNTCLILLMLCSVRNVVFVPPQFTECNTVFVTFSAKESYHTEKRDVNIFMGREVKFSNNMLVDILNALKKKVNVTI